MHIEKAYLVGNEISKLVDLISVMELKIRRNNEVDP